MNFKLETVRVLAGMAIGVVAFSTTGRHVRAQPASFTTVGIGCATQLGTPSLTNVGLPVLGGSFDIVYAGPNNSGAGLYEYRPHLVIGFSSFGSGVTIPQGLFLDQPVGCVLFARHDIVLPMPLLGPLAPRAGYEDRLTISIPNNPSLAGASFFAQWLNVYTQCGIVPPCWTGWVATSNSGVAVIGT